MDIKRDADGNVDIIVDTEKVDAHYKKQGDKVSLDGGTFKMTKNIFLRETERIGNCPKGAFWKITGAIIKTFLKRGWGKN